MHVKILEKKRICLKKVWAANLGLFGYVLDAVEKVK